MMKPQENIIYIDSGRDLEPEIVSPTQVIQEQDSAQGKQRLTNTEILNIVQRYKVRNIWEDKVVPPRRCYDH